VGAHRLILFANGRVRLQTKNAMMNERENLDGLHAWIGRECTEVQHREHDWVFSFENAGAVTCACPWRIICDDHIALANIDDEQLFGLKVPVNGP
jgi:hypothetical protein